MWTWVPRCIFTHFNVLDYGVKKREDFKKKSAHVSNLGNQENDDKGVKIILRL